MAKMAFFCNYVFPFSTDELFTYPEEKIGAYLKKSFSALESSFLMDPGNPELDLKFYFLLPASVLEALPLEALEGNDNLTVSLNM